MAHRSSSDVFGNSIDPYGSSAWTQPAAILSPLLTPEQLKWANFIVTVLFVGVVFILISRASGETPITHRIFGCFYHSFVVVRTNLVCWWIHFLRAYDEYLRVEDECRIAVIGDGIALGFGDFVTFYSKQAGVTRRFQVALNAAFKSKTLLMKWRVFNRGHFASTSENWNPTTTTKPKFHQFMLKQGSQNLFDSTFGRKSMVRGAQIVVVIVGTMDARGPRGSPGREVKYTVENVGALVEELTKRGKYVILCRLHDARQPDDKDTGFIGRHHEKNTAFARIWKSNNLVLEGANFTHVNYHIHRHGDRVHFGSSGYNLASEEMLQTLLQTCLQVENDIVLRRTRQRQSAYHK